MNAYLQKISMDFSYLISTLTVGSWADTLCIFLPWLLFHFYTLFGKRYGYRFQSVMSGMQRQRVQWAQLILTRDNRVIDSSIINGLLQGAVFFTSTTLLLIGAAVAVLGNPDKLNDLKEIVSHLPGATSTTLNQSLWEVKTLTLLSFFIYAFFKFTWSIRQLHFASLILGACPMPQADEKHKNSFIARFSEITGLSGENFTQGLRAYYFAFATLLWIYSPYAALIANLWVLYVISKREYSSPTQASIWGHSNLLLERYLDIQNHSDSLDPKTKSQE